MYAQVIPPDVFQYFAFLKIKHGENTMLKKRYLKWKFSISRFPSRWNENDHFCCGYVPKIAFFYDVNKKHIEISFLNLIFFEKLKIFRFSKGVGLFQPSDLSGEFSKGFFFFTKIFFWSKGFFFFLSPDLYLIKK